MLILFQLEAEERERFGERAPTDYHLRTAVGQRIQCRETLEDPHGIIGTEHGDGTAQADLLRPRGDGGQDHFRCGYRKVVAVVFTHPEKAEAHLIRKFCFGHEVAEHLGVVERLSGCVNGDITEGVETEFEGWGHGHKAILNDMGRWRT